MVEFLVREVRVGRVQPLGPRGVPSAIDKQPVSRPVRVGPHGVEGDEHADRRHHGGPDKAIHAYSISNYPLWAAELADPHGLLRSGAFGENLVIEGVDEAGICLGDRWRLGGVLLEVSQGRQPCWRLNLRFDRSDMARLVQATGRTGWYFRVLESGEIRAGDIAVLEVRPQGGWTIARVNHLLHHDRLNMPDLAELAALPGLPENWRRLASSRLSTGRSENWAARLDTPE